MSSYGLFNMCTACLEARESMRAAAEDLVHIDVDYLSELRLPSRTPRIRPTAFFPSLWPEFQHADYASSPGLQLLDFLHFWSYFDSYHYSVSGKTGALVAKQRTQNQEIRDRAERDEVLQAQIRMAIPVGHQAYVLNLQDGAAWGNDLGRRVHGWKHMAATIAGLWRTMRLRLDLGEGPDMLIRSQKNVQAELLAELQRRAEADLCQKQMTSKQEEAAKTEADFEAAQDHSAAAQSSAPSQSGQALRVPLLRSLIGRYDLRLEERRTRLELFARGQVAWHPDWRPEKMEERSPEENKES